MSLHVVVVARLEDGKLASKLQALRAMPEVETIDLVRRTPLQLSGVTSHCPPRFLRQVTPLAELSRLLTLFRLCRRLPRSRTFLVSFYLIPHGIFIEMARRLFGVRTIQVTLSQMDVDLALRRPWLLKMLHAAHRVGVRGPHSARRLVEHGLLEHRVFSPPNVFDLAPFTPDTALAQDVDVIFVGSFVSVKRLDVLLLALARVRAARADLRAVIVGAGPLLAGLQRQAQELGLSENVSFPGAMPEEAVARWLNRSRLFVMTSEAEGLPMAMIEALACGVPVVMNDLGDVTSVARHGENACIVADHTPEAFAEAILALLQDEPRRQALAEGARRTRARFRSEYSLPAAVAAWQQALSADVR